MPHHIRQPPQAFVDDVAQRRQVVVHDRAVAQRSGRDEHVVDAAEAREDLLYAAFIGNIHDGRVYLPQLLLGLDEYLLGAPGDRDLRAFLPGQPCGCQADATAAPDHHHVSTV
jgi:hypothetical protein